MKIIIIIIIILILSIEINLIFQNKKTISTKKIDKNIDNFNIFNYKPVNLKKYKSNDNVELSQFTESIYIEDNYGFFIYNNEYNIIKPNIIYSFNVPVDIKIIKINNNIIYYI